MFTLNSVLGLNVVVSLELDQEMTLEWLATALDFARPLFAETYGLGHCCKVGLLRHRKVRLLIQILVHRLFLLVQRIERLSELT